MESVQGSQIGEFAGAERKGDGAEGGFPGPWKAAGWLLVFSLLYVLGGFFYIVGYGGYLGAQAGANGEVLDPAAIQGMAEAHLKSPSGMLGIFIMQIALTLPVVLLAARSKVQGLTRTLSWRTFSPASLWRWMPILLAYLLLQMAAVYLFEIEPGEFMEALAGSRHLGLALVIVFAAPVLEELIFRGYLFGAWRKTRLGLAGTLLLTSGLFTLMHWGQYGWVQMSFIFALAMILGLARERSGSVLLPMALHMLNNLVAAITVIYLGIL